MTNYVELSIFNLIGQKVAVLISEIQPAGKYEIKLDASAFTSGVYYYRLQAGDFMETKKLVLLR